MAQAGHLSGPAKVLLYAGAETIARLPDGITPLCRIHEEPPPRAPDQYILWLQPSGLALLGPGLQKPFVLEEALLTSRVGVRSELVRACGIDKASTGLRIADPFGGFGVDAATLSYSGAEVVMAERQPLVWIMAREFLSRLGLSVDVRHMDGNLLLTGSSGAQTWDVVYLDPMFPETRKRALPGLAAQVLRNLAADDPFDPAHWIPAALKKAPRVVLKRRLRDPVWGQPTFDIRGKSTRYDVYLS